MGHATVQYVSVYVRSSFYLSCHFNRLLLQFTTIHKSLLKSGVFWRGHGKSWSHQTLYSGIMMDRNQLQLPVVTTPKFTNVSPSPYFRISGFVLHSNYSSSFVQKWTLPREGPSSNSRQQKGKRWMDNNLRRWVHPTHPQKERCWRSKVVSLRSQKQFWSPSWDQRPRAGTWYTCQVWSWKRFNEGPIYHPRKATHSPS